MVQPVFKYSKYCKNIHSCLKLFYFPITEMQQYLGIHEYLQYFYTHKNHGKKSIFVSSKKTSCQQSVYCLFSTSVYCIIENNR